MPQQTEIQFELIKLRDETRLLRVVSPEFGIALEKTLKPTDSVRKQRNLLTSALERMISSGELLAA